MELTQLRYFCATAKNLHITNTAKELHIAQPALTQSNKRLEKELGVPLFTSKGRNIQLTEYGRFLQKKIEPFLDMLDNLDSELSDMTEKENSTIRINLLAASHLTTQAIIQYKKRNHHINFQIFNDADADNFDVMITTKPYCHENSDTALNTYVCTEKLFMAVPHSKYISKKTSINLADVKNEDFICLGTAKSLRLICDNFCMYADFKPNIIFESDSPTAVKDCIAANMGIGFWPEFSWGILDSPDITLLPIKFPICQRDLIISHANNKSDNSQVVDFYNFLTDYFEEKKYGIK